MTIVYTGGTFDLFHAGHVELLRECRRMAGSKPDGLVVVALNPDWFVELFKGQPPVIPYAQRRIVLESCRYVDRVVENATGPDSKPTILQVGPKVLAVGSDWQMRDYMAQMRMSQQWLDQHGIELRYVPRPADGPSATKIRAVVTGYMAAQQGT